MPLFIRSISIIFLFFLSLHSFGQTVLLHGDIAVVGVATDMGACGLPAESDEFSFVAFQDIANSTTIDITDNGWETGSAGLWGNGEGTIRLTRLGAAVPAGTVITVYAINNPGGWTYQVVGGGWTVAALNPGGDFNLESGGDQLYIMQNGTWTPGGGANQATYDGDILFGYNTLPVWSANGTSQQSNLHSEVADCYHMESPSSDYYKYTSPLNQTDQLTWLHRITDGSNWTSFLDCDSYATTSPAYAGGYTLAVEQLSIGIICAFCSGCRPYAAYAAIWLPPGTFDVVYTDGTDTFYLYDIETFHAISDTLNDSATWTLISATEVGGCAIPEHFNLEAAFDVPYNNPGTAYTLSVCPDFGPIPIGIFLGPHDPGGTWVPPLDPLFNTYYSSYWGPGQYVYTFYHHDHDPPCHSDTASVTIHHIDPSDSVLEIGCDQNGTPNDITDDRLVVTITIEAAGFGADYRVRAERFNSPYGTVTPTMGTTGVPTTFTLSPGTATLTNLTLVVQDNYGQQCEFSFPLPPPGFCSNPCDDNMSATLSGDDYTCPNWCPDNPSKLYIDVEGGTEPYEADFTINAPGYPGWPFTNIPIDINQEIDICVSNVAAPFYDQSSGILIIPQFLIGSDFTFTLNNVYDDYECTALLGNDEQNVTIYPLPQIATTTIKVCYDVAFHTDLTEYDVLISGIYDVSWFDGNPLQGGDQINGPSEANLHNVVQLWAHVEDDNCENSIQVPFMILPKPDLDSIPPIEICEGDVVVLQSITLTDAGNSMPVYTFHQSLPPDTSNLLDPLYYQPADSTTIYVHATAGMCYDTLPIDINIQAYPDFTLEGQPCDLIQGTYSVLFTSSADSIFSSKGIVVNNPAGQDAINGIPNDSSVIIELINPSGLCKDTFLILAPNCNCPFIAQPVAAQPAYTICEDETIPTLSVTVTANLIANWYDVPSGGVALLQNSLTFVPPSMSNATYYVEAFDPATNCYSIRTQIDFQVYPLADLQMLADPVLCENEALDFGALIPAVLNGVPGTGQWFDLSNNQPVSGVITPQDSDSWQYVFTTNPGSCISRDTLSATVNPLPTISLHDILCDDVNLTFNLAFTSDADVVVASAGTLNAVAGTDSFYLLNIPFDTDIQIDLQNTLTGCVNTIFQEAPDCSCPALLDDDAHEVCSAQGNLDLSTFEGAGVNGTWQMVSTPAGSNPATLSGSNFQGLNADEGTYVLRFIRNIILDNCIDTALFTLDLHESPFADAGVDGTSCAPDAIVLSGSAGGSNVQFSWQTTGSNSVSNPASLNTTYTPSLADITAGSVDFTLSAIDQTGFCPSASETITITIDGSAYFILNPTTINHCDTADITVDLDDLVSFGTTGGEWFFPDTVSAPIVGNSQFNPTTLQAGTYTVFYTTSNAVPPCENDTVGVTLIIENCQCPSVALNAPSNSLCSESETQDLQDYLITTEQGTWTIVSAPSGSKPATISGTNFITADSDAGTYRLRFTLTNPVPGCPAFAEIDLDVIQTPTIQIVSSICADDLQSWEAEIVVVAENVVSNIGTLTSLGSNNYLISNITVDTDVQITATNGSGQCIATAVIDAPDCECTLTISNLPDQLSLCPGESIELEAQVTGGKGAVTSFWVVDNDSLFQNTLDIDMAGTFVFTSFDELGCKEDHEVDVIIYEEMIADITAVDITCPGDRDGSIILHGITGGNGPFFISVNGGPGTPVSSFPHIISGLSAGNFLIEITDGFSCVIETTVPILSASTESLSLGPDQTILAGDSILISPNISFIPDSFYWQGDVSFLDVTKLDNWIQPDVDQTIELFGIDEKGCLYSDDITIRVLLTSSVYVPTVFSPNGDGLNDVIGPIADGSVISFELFEVYTRWGELVYSVTNFTPADQKAWDGTRGGKMFQPGVFVYRLSATNKRGTEIKAYGDFTLVR